MPGPNSGNVTVKDIEVSGTFADSDSYLAYTEGEIGDITVTTDFYGGKKFTATLNEFDLELTDVYGSTMYLKQSYDAQSKTVTRDISSNGPFWVDVAFDSPVLSLLAIAKPADVNSIVYNYSGQMIFEIFDYNPIVGTPAEQKNGTVAVSATSITGEYLGAGELSYDAVTVDVDFVGCALLATKTAEGMTFKAFALPGYTLDGATEMANITLTKAADGTFDVTITDRQDGCAHRRPSDLQHHRRRPDRQAGCQDLRGCRVCSRHRRHHAHQRERCHRR